MKEVNLILGRFQPLTNGHLRCVEDIWNEYNRPTVIAMIDTPESKLDEKHPFPSSILLNIYKDLFKNDKRIEDIVLVKNADIVKNAEILRGLGYEIHSWSCGSDRYKSYSDMSIKYKDRAKLPDDFKCIEIKRSDEDISATKVRQALKNDDFKTFSSLTPYSTLQSMMKGNRVYNELKEWINKI